ncbi:MAG TPA: TonB-dependent receptor [Chitinophagaceae bacterium]
MRRLNLLLLLCVGFIHQLSAQQKTISGKVTDDKGQPLPAVSVLIKGTKAGTTTQQDGTFSLSVPSNAKALVFTYAGFTKEEASIDNRSVIDISLSPSDKTLDEVVVTGYGTQRKKDVTGSIATVKGGEVANRPVQSFEQALGGRAAGVQITIPNGVLNAPPVMRIRGTNSISLSSFPLIVIDGVPVFTGDVSSTSSAGNALAGLNPNDIESIDIAKDAASAAIYGSRAANGIVFITTKKGKQGKSKITYDTWVGWSKVQRLPELLDAFEYTDHKNDALKNAGSYNAATNYFALTPGPDGKPINTNWYDVVYRTGIQHSNSLSVSGANDATRYYFSAGYTDQKGIIRRNDFKRLSLLMNIDFKASKFFTVGGKIQFSNERNDAAVSSGSLGDAFATAGLGRVAFLTSPNIAPRNNDGSYNYSGAFLGVMNNKQPQVGLNNPVIQLDQNRNNSENNHLQGNTYLQFTPVKGLNIRSMYGIDYMLVDNDVYFSPISGEGINSNGQATSIFSKLKRWVWTNTIQYDFSLRDKHNISVLGGIEEQKTDNLGYGLTRINVSDPDYTTIQGGWAIPNTAGLSIGENYLYSEFGRVQYNFDRKYFLSANLRRDGASQLGNDSKYGTFYGFSGGWEISKESFWETSRIRNAISTLKLRASYGKVGNIGGLGNFASNTTFGSGVYAGSGTVVFNQAGNDNLKWETSKKLDIGLDYGLFNNKITGEINFYKNDIDDLILFVPQPPSAGLPTTIPKNIGTMYNKGVEFVISAAPVQRKDFTWRTSFNVGYNENKVTSLALGLDNIITATGGLERPSITVPGSPIGMLFVTRTAGVDPATGRRIFLNKDGQKVYFQHVAPAGQFRFSKEDGTEAQPISAADAVVFKNTNPKFSGGFDNTFRYRNFELNALFTFQTGFYIYYGSNAGLLDQRYWNNSTDILRKWNKVGDVTDIPKAVFNDNISNGSAFPLDINVFKGDFIKLRTITLSYNFPKSLVDKVNIGNARFFVAGNNLLIITNYPGPDPEVSSNGNGTTNAGIDRNTVGNARTLTVGLNITF